jgi:hypothetical protein
VRRPAAVVDIDSGSVIAGLDGSHGG